MKFKTVIGFALAAGALAFTSAAPAQTNYKAEYKMSLVVWPAFPWGKGGEIWANLVRERTQGRINIKLYPGVSLIQGEVGKEIFRIIDKAGVVPLAWGENGYREISNSKLAIKKRTT